MPHPELAAGRRLLERVAREADPGALERHLSDIDALLAEVAGDRADALRELTAALLEAKVMLLRQAGRGPEELAVLDEVIERFGDAPQRRLAQVTAWALLNRTALLINAARLDEAMEAVAALRALFERQPDRQDLAGFAEMLLDASGWLRQEGRAEPTLAAGRAIARRLTGAGTPREHATAARTQFEVARALATLERHDESIVAMEAFAAMGEPALAVLDRLQGRLVSDTPPNPAGQLLLSRVAVLTRLGRDGEARAVAAQLVAALRDDDGQVAREVRHALHALLGSTSGPPG